ncbi:hypothetical protein [Streptacidiphilus carbonis]|jgi:hypothetical protein|uniref:hypothetical protein n=1 Tax=Streptacidiphilus carbonis TaxID=105422 RepID=UPI0005A5E421|nr:hypothetical protein [Streptacidiphilus carbonis]
MTTAAVALVLIALLAYALERNHRRQQGPFTPFTGSRVGPVDRDAQRVADELAHRHPDARTRR